MNILFISFLPNGAMGQFLNSISNAFVDKGHNVSVVVHDSYVYKNNGNIKYFFYGKEKQKRLKKVFSIINPFLISRLINFIFKQKVEVIHIVGGEFHPWFFIIKILSFITKSKLVVSVHDDTAHDSFSLDWFLLLFRPIILKNADRIHFLRSCTLFENYKNKSFIVEHGSFCWLFENCELSNSLVKDIDLLFLGRLENYKGIDIFLQSLNYVLPNKKNKIMIGGPGKLSENLKKLISENNIQLENRYISDCEFASFLRRAKFLILPYRNVTQSALPLIANSFKCRVIASELGDFINIVPKIDGFLFTSEDYLMLAEQINKASYDDNFKDMKEYLFKNQVNSYVLGYNFEKN